MFTLGSTGISHPLLTLDSPDDPASECPVSFTVYLVDSDGDGESDPHSDDTFASFGLHDVWPKIYLLYYTQEDGTALPEGESWASEAVVYDAAFLAAGYTPGSVFQTDSLPVLYMPGAKHTLPDGTEELVYAPDLPTGYWGIAVFSHTGQTWVTPNQLADEHDELNTA